MLEETIDLREYFQIIKKRISLIVIITITFMAISAIISFYVIQPVYEANTTLIVNAEQNKTMNNIITGDQLDVTQKLTLTYGEIIKSKSVLNSVADKLGLNKTYEEMSKIVSVDPVKDTQIISINVKSHNPELSRDIANTIPKVFTKEAKRITNANSVEVIDKARTPEKPTKPNKIMNIAIAGVLGVMSGILLVFTLEYMGRKIKTPQDIQKYLNLATLGVIPNEKIENKDKKKKRGRRK